MRCTRKSDKCWEFADFPPLRSLVKRVTMSSQCSVMRTAYVKKRTAFSDLNTYFKQGPLASTLASTAMVIFCSLPLHVPPLPVPTTQIPLLVDELSQIVHLHAGAPLSILMITLRQFADPGGRS